MLTGASGVDELPAEAVGILAACAGLPLTLAVAGALCKGGDGTAWAKLEADWGDLNKKMLGRMPETASPQHT